MPRDSRPDSRGVGDIAEVRYGQSIVGMSAYAESTSADTVTVWITNLTNGALDLGSLTIYAQVTKATP